jgi:hypothetical protein
VAYAAGAGGGDNSGTPLVRFIAEAVAVDMDVPVEGEGMIVAVDEAKSIRDFRRSSVPVVDVLEADVGRGISASLSEHTHQDRNLY